MTRKRPKMKRTVMKTTESSDDGYKFAFLQHDVACTVQDKVAIPKTWILLDSQSTVDMFSNPKFLTNIRDAKRDLTLYCNAGKAIINKKVDLKGYGTVTSCPWAMSRKNTG